MDPRKLPKIYDSKMVESRWYQHWLERGYFHAEPDSGKEAYTIVIPPPNVTGMLTMGHVLNNTMQDILIRRARMEGKEACWVPGTDHASIATEARVASALQKRGISKDDLGREEFVNRVWTWKQKYGGMIIQQLKKLGCSCDWERERFTMDDGYTRAVLGAFVRLYRKGLIYRGHRLVNWCPVSKSAISDEEVIHREIEGKLWYLKYPFIGSDDYVVVATTRPETMLGDTAVAVNPHDDRFGNLVGKTVMLPLAERGIPVIADELVDPRFGTGCVKVTPAHDPNDFVMGKKHGLEFVNIMNEDASLNESVPERYRGLSREEARSLVVEDLRNRGLLDKVEDYTHNVGFSERGHVPIEYYMSEQWFLKMSELAKPAIDAVNLGRIRFYPQHWLKTYNHWMENIKDWCISRQLWWGHRIPVHTCQDCGEVMVQVDAPATCAKCKSSQIERDPDVLDTWFSSWLWPFAVHDWPEQSEDLKFFYPTDTLVTGPDIIFFWVARMIIAGYEFMGDVPFRHVYFTSILRDSQGRKFSKSLGNSPNPFDLFEEFGTDAVRFGIMLMAPQGLDVLFSNERLEVGRNFMNKLWNAARLLLMSATDVTPKRLAELDELNLELADRWILSRLNRTIADVEAKYGAYRFNEIAKRIYDFTWADFCDWYVEIIKPRLYGSVEEAKTIAFSTAVHVIKIILKLLHPYAPFITEELWHRFDEACPLLASEEDLIVATWPAIDESRLDDQSERQLARLQEIVTAIRTVRSMMNVPPGKRSDLFVKGENESIDFIRANEGIVSTLAKVDNITIGDGAEPLPHSATVVVGELELFIPLEGLIDIEKEKQRLTTQISRLEFRLQRVESKLQNESFVTKAPETVVQKERKKLRDIVQNLSKLKANYAIIK